jgi:hypothetical protein
MLTVSIFWDVDIDDKSSRCYFQYLDDIEDGIYNNASPGFDD